MGTRTYESRSPMKQKSWVMNCSTTTTCYFGILCGIFHFDQKIGFFWLPAVQSPDQEIGDFLVDWIPTYVISFFAVPYT